MSFKSCLQGSSWVSECRGKRWSYLVVGASSIWPPESLVRALSLCYWNKLPAYHVCSLKGQQKIVGLSTPGVILRIKSNISESHLKANYSLSYYYHQITSFPCIITTYMLLFLPGYFVVTPILENGLLVLASDAKTGFRHSEITSGIFLGPWDSQPSTWPSSGSLSICLIISKEFICVHVHTHTGVPSPLHNCRKSDYSNNKEIPLE